MATDAAEPVHATLFVVDIVGFGARTNTEQLVAREILYGMLSTAFNAGHVPWPECLHEDRGDGALVMVPGDVPKTFLLDRVLGALIDQVSAQQAEAGSDAPAPLRLKVAVHSGEVHGDADGLVGFDVNHAFRLLESELVRYAIRTSSSVCVVIVSDSIYQSVLRHGYGGIAAAEYAMARVVNGDDERTAWLRLPGTESGASKAVRGFAKEKTDPPPESME